MAAIYNMPAPYHLHHTIEVYGEPDNGAYEWRLLDADGAVLQDTATEGTGRYRGRMYGNPEIALRDALMVASGLDDPHLEQMRRVADEVCFLDGDEPQEPPTLINRSK